MLIAGISLSRYLGVKAPLTRVQVNQVSEMDAQGHVSHLWILHVVQLVITVKNDYKSMLSKKNNFIKSQETMYIPIDQ